MQATPTRSVGHGDTRRSRRQSALSAPLEQLQGLAGHFRRAVENIP